LSLVCQISPSHSPEMATVTQNIHEMGDFRAMPASAWTGIYAHFAPAGSSQMEASADITESPAAASEDVFGTPMGKNLEESPFHVPDDAAGTPEGPNLTPGKPLAFLRDATPSPDAAFRAAKAKCRDALRAALGSSPSPDTVPLIIATDDDVDVQTLEAVSPMFAGDVPEENSSPTGAASPTPKSPTSAWKRMSAALPNTPKTPVIAAIPEQVSAQAQKVKEQVSALPETVSAQAQKAKEQVSDTVSKAAQGARKVPGQVSDTAQRSMEFVKEQTQSALKVPAHMTETAKKLPAATTSTVTQVSESAKKSFGNSAQISEAAKKNFGQLADEIKVKAGTAQEKAQTVSAAVKASVSQTTQKGIDMAKNIRPQAQGKVGGA